MQMSHYMTWLTSFEPMASNWSGAEQLARQGMRIFQKNHVLIFVCIKVSDTPSPWVKWLVPHERSHIGSFA